jgi:hypothetical protein
MERVAEQLRIELRAARPNSIYRDRVRAQLVAARAAAIAERDAAARSATGQPVSILAAPRRRAGARRPMRLAGLVAAATLVAGTSAVVAERILSSPGTVAVAAASDVVDTISADPSAAVTVRFSRPVDQSATVAALRVTPATQLRTSWSGQALTVTPLHGFSPNTPYSLQFDQNVARTATGARFAGTVGLSFGTAPSPAPPLAHAAPLDLAAQVVAPVQDGSEAPFTADGALLVTDARPSPATGYRGGLVRLQSGTSTTVSGATDAICVSRSGNSVAFLAHSGAATQLVFADRVADPTGRTDLSVDPGSPLGWIDDAEVSFVSSGHLRAVDRDGRVRLLSPLPVDAAHDALAIAPGGRYVYLRAATAGSGSPGQILDLVTGTRHRLPGAVGTPTFTADGATVVWVDTRAALPRLAVAASSGGPILLAPLPVTAGDQISDLAVSPDGVHLAYTLTDSTRATELRLASLPDGRTLATSSAAGGSVNWAPSGQAFSFLRSGTDGAQIDRADLPAPLVTYATNTQAVASAFARAQVGGDGAAQRALGAAGLVPPDIPAITRASILWLVDHPDGTTTARLRLTIDPGPGHQTAQVADESLTLATGNRGLPVITRATLTPFADAANGPQLTGVQTSPTSIHLTFASDLDPSTVATGVSLTSPAGPPLPHLTTYDPTTRTVTLQVTDPPPGQLTVTVATGLSDVDHHHPPAALTIPVVLHR